MLLAAAWKSGKVTASCSTRRDGCAATSRYGSPAARSGPRNPCTSTSCRARPRHTAPRPHPLLGERHDVPRLMARRRRLLPAEHDARAVRHRLRRGARRRRTGRDDGDRRPARDRRRTVRHPRLPSQRRDGRRGAAAADRRSRPATIAGAAAPSRVRISDPAGALELMARGRARARHAQFRRMTSIAARGRGARASQRGPESRIRIYRPSRTCSPRAAPAACSRTSAAGPEICGARSAAASAPASASTPSATTDCPPTSTFRAADLDADRLPLAGRQRRCRRGGRSHRAPGESARLRPRARPHRPARRLGGDHHAESVERAQPADARGQRTLLGVPGRGVSGPSHRAARNRPPADHDEAGLRDLAVTLHAARPAAVQRRALPGRRWPASRRDRSPTTS